MVVEERKRNKRNLAIFIVGVMGLSAFAGIIDPFTLSPDAGSDAAGLGQLIWLVSPLLVVLLLRIFGGDGFRDIGLRPNFKGNGFWWLISILIFPLVITITISLGIVFGSITLDVNMFSSLGAVFIGSLLSALVKNIFEEFAWRGYLVPKVQSLGLNTWLSHVIVGVVWGAWHLPFIQVFWTYLTPGMLWAFIPLFFLGTISQSVVYGEIRMATNSVLPAWLMHTLGNAIGNTLLLSGFIRFTAGKELLFSLGVEGVISIVLMLVIGFWLVQKRKR